jgi:rod shape determining protein RodA
MRRIFGYDSGLTLATFGLVTVGIYVLFTSIVALDGSVDTGYGWRQLIFAILGLTLAVIASRVDLTEIEQRWKLAYFTALGSILFVLVVGAAVRGSRRWVEVGPVNVQPSEIGKVLVILAIAGFLAQRTREIEEARTLALVAGLVALPALLVFIQPDFGTSQVYAAIGVALVFFAGARWLHLGTVAGFIVLLAVLVMFLLPAVGVQVLKDYQMDRLTGFADPNADPQGANYHTIQSKIAIGSGRLWGKPAAEASQVKESFLPEPHTDFIFATLVERHGFFGGALTLALFAMLISRCLHGVSVAPTQFGRLICGAVAVMFTAQVFVNVGMTIGITPVTGVPLPFVSYGGSAMLANLIAVGLVASVLRSCETAHVRYARRARTSRRRLQRA